MLGLYKCNYSFTRGKELYIWPFEGNREADVAPGENEFDTPGLEIRRQGQRPGLLVSLILYDTH